MQKTACNVLATNRLFSALLGQNRSFTGWGNIRNTRDQKFESGPPVHTFMLWYRCNLLTPCIKTRSWKLRMRQIYFYLLNEIPVGILQLSRSFYIYFTTRTTAHEYLWWWKVTRHTVRRSLKAQCCDKTKIFAFISLEIIQKACCVCINTDNYMSSLGTLSSRACEIKCYAEMSTRGNNESMTLVPKNKRKAYTAAWKFP